MNEGIVVCGLNSAYQRIVLLDSLKLGDVNRASEALVGVGGKGQNVVFASSCIAKCLRVFPRLVQFVGSGNRGDELVAALDLLSCGLGKDGITVRTKSACRQCTTLIVRGGEVTEIVEPAGSIEDEERIELLQALDKGFPGVTSVAGIALMGSLPGRCPAAIYGEVIRRCCSSHTKVLIDSVYGLADALRACGDTDCASVVIKINTAELFKIAGFSLNSTDVTRHDLHSAVLAAERNLDVSAASRMMLSWAITQGANRAFLVTCGVCLQFGRFVNRRLDICNPIGAGDTVAASFLHTWTGNLSLDHMWQEAPQRQSQLSEESLLVQRLIGPTNLEQVKVEQVQQLAFAFRVGLACGTASCFTVRNAELDLRRAVLDDECWNRWSICETRE